ncbi:MAG TPA: tetratricopeptide repeat protein, partial [Anaeromyxobacteraceae bacterium]
MSSLLRALTLIMLAVATLPARAGEVVPDVPRASGPALADYLRARLAGASGDRAGALEALRHALVHDPLSPQLRMSYAEALARSGELVEAEAEARRALLLAPHGPAGVDARLALGRILAQAHHLPEAAAELSEAAQIEGELAKSGPPESIARELDPEPWRELARVRLEGGNEAGAATACEDLAALDPAEGAAGLRELAAKLLDARQEAAAEKRLRRAVELAPSEPEGWKLLARLDEARGHDAQARISWERALANDPDDPETLLAAGQLALRTGDLTAARAWLRQAVRATGDEATARARVATIWLEAKQPAEALEAAHGEDPRLAYLRGLALQQLKRWADAATAFSEVPVASGELYASARASLAFALSRAGKPAEAVKAVKRGLSAQPGDPTLLYALGEAYDRAGQREAALAQMRAVLAVKADHAEALNFLGYALAERGEHLDEAQAFVERALRVDPQNGYYLDSLGWVLFKRGDVPRALQALERAERLAGPEATILEHLGDVYRRAARPADAAGAYRRALTAPDPDTDDDRVHGKHRAALERKLRELGP